jgi:uncharacterized SAM-binding protein YcdF (DUF218 family)
MTDRERFMAILANGSLLESDAVVVLCGEDAKERVRLGAGLMLANAAPKLVLTGGVEDERRMKASTAIGLLLGEFGLSPSKILVDDGPQNTREQAVAIVDQATREEWNRFLLVASPYHIYRATLTFLKALQEAGVDDKVRIIPVPTSQVAWGEAPDGMTETRLELLNREFQKIDAYTDHVASYVDGSAYLLLWEVQP